MPKSVWQQCSDGVELYVPSNAALSATRRALSRLSVSEEPEASRQPDRVQYVDSSLPSQLPFPAAGSGPSIKQEPVDEQEVECPSSPSTLSIGSDDIHFTPGTSASECSLPAQRQTVFDQLKEYAAPSESPSPAIGAPILGSSGYQSDRTDFLPLIETPCPDNGQDATPPPMLKKSRLFRRSAQEKRKGPTASVRRPDWIKTAGSGIRKAKYTPIVEQRKTDNMLSLEKLQSIERVPAHKWSQDERELLCVLYRWYHAPDRTVIPQVFNSITSLNLRHNIIKIQFENHIRLYGRKAFREFERVFHSVPFQDPMGRYEEIKSIIEATAQNLGIPLCKREVETKFPSGRAARAKSEHTRKIYRTLVRQASQNSRPQGSKWPSRLESSSPMSALGGFPTATREKFADSESLVDEDAEVSPASRVCEVTASPVKSFDTPCLAFRAWDASSRTVFRDGGEGEGGGFVADLFAKRRGPVTRPLPRDDEYGLFDVLANAHLSFKGNASAFVSVVTSLLQVFNYASKMNDPQIAVIMLDNPEINISNKLHSARAVISHLQAQGEMWWTRYKANCEYLVWGDIPQSAILHVFRYAELEHLSEHAANVANLLHLDFFNGQSRTKTISRRLQRENTVLNRATAKVMAEIAIVFGLGRHSVTQSQIAGFITTLVDSWVIQDAPINDAHSLSELAACFAMALNNSRLNLQDVMGGFVDGVRRGTDNIARYVGRQPRTER